MVRLLISGAIYLVGNAVGLLVAAWALDDMSIDGAAFITEVVIFTVVVVVARPLFTQIAIKNAGALVGSTALIATLVGLVVTAWVSDGLSRAVAAADLPVTLGSLTIDGALTWVLATLIVWPAALIAGLILPALNPNDTGTGDSARQASGDTHGGFPPRRDDAAANIGGPEVASEEGSGWATAWKRLRTSAALPVALAWGALVAFILLARSVNWPRSSSNMLGLGFGVLGMGLAFAGGGIWGRLSDGGTRRSPLVGELATDVGVALMTGAIVGLVLFVAQDAVEEDRFVRDVRRDNVRFVREVASQPASRAKPFAGLDLRDALLIGLDLSDADLSFADLTGAGLLRANLTDASLSNADLTGASLSNANLTGANLAGADLTDANLRDANLTGTELGFADLTNADLVGADLTGADLTAADLTGADLSESAANPDDRDANLTGADLNLVHYDESTEWPDGFEPPPSSGSS
ncbi:MAG: pentapeptide repeat-containing protein [Acidimicrobiales bacterium]